MSFPSFLLYEIDLIEDSSSSSSFPFTSYFEISSLSSICIGLSMFDINGIYSFIFCSSLDDLAELTFSPILITDSGLFTFYPVYGES